MLAFLSALMIIGPISNAQAIELFGKCFGSSCAEQSESDPEITDPRFYEVNLNISSPEDVQAVIEGRSQLWRNRDAAVPGSAGLLSRARGDYKRIISALYDEGYYGGSVSIKVNGSEAAEINPGTVLPDKSYVTIKVDAGRVYRFGEFLIENPAPEPISDDDFVETPKDLAVDIGDVAKATMIGRAARLEVARWRELGHPFAKISDQRITANHPANELKVVVFLDPGPKAVFGNTTVEGAESVDADFVAYMAGLEPGKEYDPDDIKLAESRLDRLGVFSLRKIELGKTVDESGAVPILVTVDERKPRRIGIGATVSTTEGAGLEAFWLHRNLYGRAERFRIEGAVNGLGETFQGDELDYRLGLTYTKPGVFNPDTDWINNLYARRDFNDTFDGETFGGSSVLNRRFSDSLSGSAGGFAEYSDFTDGFGSRTLFTAGFIASATYDNRNDKLDASEGILARLEAKPFHEFERSNTAARLEAELRAYAGLDPKKETVLAGRLKLGSLLGISRPDAPSNFLFFAGGGGSVRGFDFNNIGVEEGGLITGGRSLFEGSVELRHRINDTWGAVVFADFGLVGEESFIDFDEEVRVGVGAGVRYYTGLGPIRLDFAVPLNPQSNDPDFAIFAGIGQAF